MLIEVKQIFHESMAIDNPVNNAKMHAHNFAYGSNMNNYTLKPLQDILGMHITSKTYVGVTQTK